MSLPYRQLLSQAPPDGDYSTLVPYSRTISGQLQLTRLFLALEQRNLPREHAPTIVDVSTFLEKVDRVSLPYECSESDPVHADKFRAHKNNTDSLWETLLLCSTPSSSAAPSTGQPPPSSQQPLLGDHRAAANEARKRAEEIEKSRLRAVVSDIQGPGNNGGNYTNEFVTARASELFVGQAALLAACSALVCVTFGISAFDDDGITPTAPAKILAKIPQDGAAITEWTAILQALDNMEESAALFYKGWKTMHRSFNTSWRNMVQMEWQAQEDAQERRINPAHPMLSTFEEKLALSITRLKENVPGSICPAAAQPAGRAQTTTPKKDEAENNGKDRPSRAAPRPPKKANFERKKNDKPFNRDYPSRRINYDREDYDRGDKDYHGGGDRSRGGGDRDRDRDRRGNGGNYYKHGRGGDRR